MKKLLFVKNVMQPVTCANDRFIMIMATFSQYELTAPISGSHSAINRLLQRLLRYFNAEFEFEFPFFLILANRMYE